MRAKLKQKDNLLIFEPFGNTERLLCEKVYEIKEYKSNRSNEQNRLMWAIIQSISKSTQNDEMDVYIAGLEHANVKPEFIAGLPDIENDLKKVFRAVKPFGTVLTEEGKELVRYKVYIGSSKFNTNEMTMLVNYFIQKAQELGIESEGL